MLTVMHDTDTDADDPVERRKRQREAKRRRLLTFTIIGGGLIAAAAVISLIALGVQGRLHGVPDSPDGHKPEGTPVHFADQLIVGQIVTVEGEVVISGGGPVERGRVVMMLKCYDISVSCMFTAETNAEKWHHDTRRGDRLKVTGRVRESTTRTASLEECKFVGQVLRK